MKKDPNLIQQQNASGFVSVDCIYTLAEIKKRLRLGKAAMRQARRSGLKVRKIGRQRYVLGKDLFSYLEQSVCSTGPDGDSVVSKGVKKPRCRGTVK